eukprot:TRINITY_DN18264_c0_g1_i1.p1 TRINITY_DN18264_c0_g1~~TRINITY_DN18264_c0_g1_i1.p1  ORF type:complete len:343 (+),score=35.54 TRINITY_DN18264_c0_g1_i1:123-1151(+)
MEQYLVQVLSAVGSSPFESLGVKELAAAQVSCKDVNSLLHQDLECWKCRCEEELPNFELSPVLFERKEDVANFLQGMPCLKSTRLAAHSEVNMKAEEISESRRESISPPQKVRLSGLRHAQRLVERLQQARKMAAEHVASGGASAQTELVRYDFPVDAAGQVLHTKTQWFQGLGNTRVIFGTPMIIPDQSGSLTSTCLHLHIAQLKFGDNTGKLLMALRDDSAPSSAISFPRTARPNEQAVTVHTVHVCSVDQRTIHCKGRNMRVNGAWVDAEGLYSLRGPTAEDIYTPLRHRDEAAPPSGLLCVLCVKSSTLSADETKSMFFDPNRSVNALQIDRPRGSSA